MQMVRLIDAHCHLQDKRLAVTDVASLIGNAASKGVSAFAVNGTSEEDWKLVKEMSETHSSVIPNFGLHPWFAGKSTSNWLTILKGFFEAVPSAAMGEIGLDKGCPQGKEVDFALQIQVFKQQLELGKQLQRPISIHCVSAFGELHEIIKGMGTFPAGIILHSYIGSAEMVQRLAEFGAYFSFSGFITFKKLEQARKIVRAVPMDRILLETDAPDALPNLNLGFLVWVPGDPSIPLEFQEKLQYQLRSDRLSNEQASPVQENRREGVDSSVQKKALNHPANIYTVLKYVAYLLEISEEKLAQISYENAVRVFSYPGSKLC